MTMRKLLTAMLCTLILLCARSSILQAQGLEGYGGGFKIYLSKDSTTFVRLLFWNQIWIRWMQQNPGTSVSNNPETRETFDIGIRRSRMLVHGQLTPRILLFWIIGVNNQTFNSGGLGIASGFDPTSDGKRQQVFVHDAWCEFKWSRELFIGAGLLTWSGLSRQTNWATLNYNMLDASNLGWINLDATDQFARMFGIYAKGEIGHFNYRAVLSKPFTIPNPGLATPIGGTTNQPPSWAAALTTLPPAYNISQWAGNNNELLYHAYVNYDFFEQESSVLPFMVGSYLGTKKVFNIGVGFNLHPRGMWHRIRPANPAIPEAVARTIPAADLNTLNDALRRGIYPAGRGPGPSSAPGISSPEGSPLNITDSAFYNAWGRLNPTQQAAITDAFVDTAWTDTFHWAVDFFLDLPLRYKEDGTPDPTGPAITAHGAFYNYNFGPNYVRNIGVMSIGQPNPTAVGGQLVSQPEFNGPGNAYPLHGTGQAYYLQASYLTPREWTEGWGRFQFFGAITYLNYQRLREPTLMPEFGFNWILAGQNAKISMQFRPRAIYGRAISSEPGRELLDGMRRVGTRWEAITQFHIYL